MKYYKVCEICGIIFETTRSFKKYCSPECYKKHLQQYGKKYYKDNKEKKKQQGHEYYLKNKDKILQKTKEWSANNHERVLKNHNIGKRRRRKENPEKYRCKDRIYNKNKCEEVKERIRIKRRNKWKNNFEYRLKSILSHQIRDSLINNKTFKTFDLLDYSIDNLKKHLESLFQDGMNWDNYGYYGWHIDHIKPIASFNLINEDRTQNLEEIKKCWSLENLQPLWAKDNISKGSWYIDEDGNKKQYRHNT